MSNGKQVREIEPITVIEDNNQIHQQTIIYNNVAMSIEDWLDIEYQEYSEGDESVKVVDEDWVEPQEDRGC